jgi:ketosteroid isomerase-like protein
MAGPDDQDFGPEWIREYFLEVDRRDPDGLLRWYANEASFRFANQPPAQGEAAIRELLTGFYGTIATMQHVPLGVWADANSGAMEAEVRFGMPDGREIRLPAVSVLRVRDRRVHDFRFVMDASPLQESGR